MTDPEEAHSPCSTSPRHLYLVLGVDIKVRWPTFAVVALCSPAAQHRPPPATAQASQEEIRRAYLSLARKWHPDRQSSRSADSSGLEEVSKRRFQVGGVIFERAFADAHRLYRASLQEISAAFSVLSNQQSRSKYDLGLLELLDVEDYLQRFQGLILTASGLGMGLSDSGSSDDASEGDDREHGEFTSRSPEALRHLSPHDLESVATVWGEPAAASSIGTPIL